jgi:predicted ATP-dependent protease
VCKALGLDGKQGVMIPQRNAAHLMLDAEVIAAVEAGQFHIITIAHILEGISYLTNTPASAADAHGDYAENTVMGQAMQTLLRYKKILENNKTK